MKKKTNMKINIDTELEQHHKLLGKGKDIISIVKVTFNKKTKEFEKEIVLSERLDFLKLSNPALLEEFEDGVEEVGFEKDKKLKVSDGLRYIG